MNAAWGPPGTPWGDTPTVCHDAPMALNRPVGRPRSGPRRRHGATARDEIIDAAAELFTQLGYAATSTRAIAEAVGIKQASLYYHFANKEQILFDLLLATVQPTRAVATLLLTDPPPPPGQAVGPAPAQLWALAAYDVHVLCSGRWNLGALYLLPEVHADRFAPFRRERDLLRDDYGILVERGVEAGAFAAVEDVETATYLVFLLVEGVISLRQETLRSGGLPMDVDTLSATVADGALRLLGLPPGAIPPARTVARSWLAAHALPSATSP